MSIVCKGENDRFVLKGIDGYPHEVVLEKAKPGWSAVAKAGSKVEARDSALTRGRAVERLLRQTVMDEQALASMMNEVDGALGACPE